MRSRPRGRLPALAPGARPGDLLPETFAQEDFAFYGKVLQGQKELEPRWKRCVAQVDQGLGHILGKAFVDRNFPGDSKQISLEMIQRVENAFAARLPELSWMDDATRQRALEKLHAVRNQIGYPTNGARTRGSR
jgi:endothelin-converting enzyme/putative endopeptidase